MNELNIIISSNNYERDKLYLIKKMSQDCCFFYQNGVVFFGKKSQHTTSDESIDTVYLDLNMNVFVESLIEGSSMESGYYDLLSYKGDIDEYYFDLFYNICNSFCIDNRGMSFYDFFNSLVDLFQISKEQNYKNLIGLIGELLFIKESKEKYSINLSNNWHLTGSYSKFDFSLPEFNIDVKTTSKSRLAYEIKHDQLFNSQKNYVAVVSLIETGEGESINSLVDYFTKDEIFRGNVDFQIAISKELLRIPDEKSKKRGFALERILVFPVAQMERIKDIPDCISNLTYTYDFSSMEEIELSEIFSCNLQ